MTEDAGPRSTSNYSLAQNSNGPRTKILHNTTLDIYREPHTLRRTGIICTIGYRKDLKIPGTDEVKSADVLQGEFRDKMQSLVDAGMNVVRMNFSHGTHETHGVTVGIARQVKANVCIALDTKGPEIRTGNFVDGNEYKLVAGSQVRVSVDPADKETGTAEKFYVDYTNLPKVVDVNSLIYVDDGLVSLRVVGKDEQKEPMFVDCVVENSGDVSNHKGVNLPNIEVDLPAISEKDKGDLVFGLDQEVNMVFASFIRKAQDVLDIRNFMIEAASQFPEKYPNPERDVPKKIKIISKIENHQGVQNFDEILQVTDGVMVARGDLGIEIDPEKVFLAQKMMISKCNLANKPIIVATQMLDSMIKNPRPTRAEVSDVANAVLDGADCVMLSGETAKGKYPTQAVSIMARICLEAESALNPLANFLDIRASVSKPFANPSESVCCAAVLACFEQEARLMIVLTNSGTTGRIIAKYRPPCPVVAVVSESSSYTAKQLEITSGVFPVVYTEEEPKSYDERVQVGIDFAIGNGWVQAGESAVCVHADTRGKGYANLMKIITV